SLKHPSNASGRGVQRLHQAAGASDEEISIEDCRLRKGNDVLGKSVGPLQLETRHISETDAGKIGGLVSRIREGRAPSIPLSLAPATESHGTIRAKSRSRRFAAVARNAQVLGDGFTLLLPELRRDVVHHTEIQRAENARDAELLQFVARRNAVAARI